MNKERLIIKGISHFYGPSSSSEASLNKLNLSLSDGEIVGLLGPSGCGKTTLLRLIAGFEKLSAGYISIDQKIVASTSIHVPPEKRGVGMVFQDYALFPHMNCWKNVCFGLRKGQDCSRALWLLTLLGIEEFKFRYPHEMSGGQRQRLALARALAPGSSLVLLDEPFSNLDVEVRMKLRGELAGVLNTCSASGLFVTHDPQEALAICDRVAVMKEGVIHQCSSPRDLVDRPETSFVAKFVLQRNSLPITNTNSEMRTVIGSLAKYPGSSQTCFTEVIFDDQSVNIKSNLNGIAVVKGKEFYGNYWLVRLKIQDHEIRVRTPLDKNLTIGDRCDIKFISGKPVLLFPGSIGHVIQD